MHFWNQSLSNSDMGLEVLLFPLQNTKWTNQKNIDGHYRLHFIITSVKEVVFGNTGLFVHQSICAQDHLKCYKQN